jgi:3',5'-cyclic AMP phosphodiesterase CpdA
MEINELEPDVVVCSGDLTTFGFQQEYAEAKAYLDHSAPNQTGRKREENRAGCCSHCFLSPRLLAGHLRLPDRVSAQYQILSGAVWPPAPVAGRRSLRAVR